MEVDIEGSDDDSIVPADEKIAPKDLRRIQQLLKKLKFWGKIVIHYARGYLMFWHILIILNRAEKFRHQ